MPQFSDLSIASTEELILRFERAAIAYATAEADENLTEMDWQDRVKSELSREVRRRGQEAESMFLRLLSHENSYVRAESAMYAIHFAPAQAVPILAEIGKLRGQIGYYARMVLNRYLASADAGYSNREWWKLPGPSGTSQPEIGEDQPAG